MAKNELKEAPKKCLSCYWWEYENWYKSNKGKCRLNKCPKDNEGK